MKSIFKRCIFLSMIFSSPVFFAGPAPAQAYPPQEQGHEKIIEKVTVTNVEVLVRVFYQGQPVANLGKDDFIILENKKEVAINGFFIKRKKIKVTGTMDVTVKEKPAPLPARAFVLVFKITDYNDHIIKAVNHLFENTLRKSDRLLVFANDKTMSYATIENKEIIKRQILSDLKEESRKVRRELVRYINQIETNLRVSDFRRQLLTRQDNPEDRLFDFLKKYLISWNEYKRKYLTPSLDHFYFFARYLEEVKAEKWVFNFYQFDLFPNIMLGSRTMQKLRDIAEQLTRSPKPAQHVLG